MKALHALWGEGSRVVFGRQGSLPALAVSGLLILASAADLIVPESATVRASFPDAIRWAIVTATAVGYGDIAPTTFQGGAIGVVLRLTGVGLISTLAAFCTPALPARNPPCTCGRLPPRFAFQVLACKAPGAVS